MEKVERDALMVQIERLESDLLDVMTSRDEARREERKALRFLVATLTALADFMAVDSSSTPSSEDA